MHPSGNYGELGGGGGGGGGSMDVGGGESASGEAQA